MKSDDYQLANGGMTCPKCGTSGHQALYGQPSKLPNGHQANTGLPHICADCLSMVGGKTTGQLMDDLKARRA